MADGSAVTAKREANGDVKAGDGTGVGVAASVNVVTVENVASIQSDNDITAGSITVKSSAVGKKQVEKTEKGEDGKDKKVTQEVDQQTPVRTYSVSGAGAAGVGVAGSVAISRISGDIDAFIRIGKDAF